MRGRVLAGLLLIGLVDVGAASAASAADVVSDGPLTRVSISEDLSCAVNHASDSRGEFYADIACGTLLALGDDPGTSTLYGPSQIPAGSGASPRTSWTPVSQSPVTGRGTVADPYRVVTVVEGDGVRLTETDSYVAGQEAYRTDVAVTNTGLAPTSAVLYRAGDCYLQDSDFGYGDVDVATGAVGCTADSAPGSRIEQWFPISAGSSYMEGGYHEVWSAIGRRQPFRNTCRCEERIDNGAGLSWTLDLPVGATQTRAHLTSFSPVGLRPLGTSKTADEPVVVGGGENGYTITLTNSNIIDITVTSVYDDLPEGFRYRPGTTTGAVDAEPTVDGRRVTWAVPVTVPAQSSRSLHFGVTATEVGGVHYNDAGGTADAVAVAPTGGTAPVRVLERTEVSVDPVLLDTTPAVHAGRVTARVTSARTGQPLPDRDVRFTTGAALVCAATTDDAGRASCSATGSLLQLVLEQGYDAAAAATETHAAGAGRAGLLRVGGPTGL